MKMMNNKELFKFKKWNKLLNKVQIIIKVKNYYKTELILWKKVNSIGMKMDKLISKNKKKEKI